MLISKGKSPECVHKQTKKGLKLINPVKPQHASSCISSYPIKKQSKIICRVYVCSKASVVENHHKPIWSTIKLCGYTHCVRVTAHLAHGTPSFFPVTDGGGRNLRRNPTVECLYFINKMMFSPLAGTGGSSC